jgi:hypothetical protein
MSSWTTLISMSPQLSPSGFTYHLRTGLVQILHHFLTTQTKLWDFIKSSVLYLLVHMKFSLRFSFYLKHSLGGYTVGTTMGFPVGIVLAVAPQSHHRILWKCPQYHMSTYSAHHRVTGSGHPLNRGVDGYYWCNIPWAPWATGYDPKFWIRSIPSSGKWLENHIPLARKWPHHSRLKWRGHQPKKNQSWKWSTPSLHLMNSVGRQDFTTCLPLPPFLSTRGRDPGPPGLPTMDKHHPL